jgi:hypothetical protein
MNNEQRAYYDELRAKPDLDNTDVWVQYVMRYGMDGPHYDELQKLSRY